MRKLLTLCLFFYAGLTFAQIHTGDIWLTSQSAVDSFSINYPGIKKVVGRMVIGKADTVNLSDITDLSPLEGFEWAQDMYISNNGLLSSLHGLEAMDTIGAITLYHNPALQSLYGLHHVRNTDVVIVRCNDALTNLQGLNSLQKVYAMSIERCANLINLSGLDSLSYTFGGITIAGNKRLKTVSGMLRLSKIVLDVSYNDSLLHFGQFPSLTSGSFRVYNNANLVDFSGFAGIVPNTIALDIHDNPQLVSLDAFSTVKRGGMYIKDNILLKEVCRFDSLDNIYIDIAGPQIQKVFFPAAKSVRNFEIHNCPRLKKMENFLPVADSISGGFWIYDNDSLQSVHLDYGPTYLYGLKIYNNPQLRSITGFNGIQRSWKPTPSMNDCVYQNCGVYINSPVLDLVSGFNNLKNGRVQLRTSSSNHAVERIEGFNAHGAIFEHIEIQLNSKTISGFRNSYLVDQYINISTVHDTLSIFHNLEQIGPSWVYGLEVRTTQGCYHDTLAFSRLKYMRQADLYNACFGGNPIRFPSLESIDVKGLITWENNDLFSNIGAYPKLKKTGLFVLEDCSRIRTLKGIEGISSIKAGQGFKEFFKVSDCDSLSDCSAICWLRNNGAFQSVSNDEFLIENNPVPCSSLADIDIYCDTLTSSTGAAPVTNATPNPMRVWPNPIQSGALTISLGDDTSTGVYPLRVTDNSGRVALAGQLNFSNGIATLHITMLPAGHYWLSVQNTEGRARSVAFVKNEE